MTNPNTTLELIYKINQSGYTVMTVKDIIYIYFPCKAVDGSLVFVTVLDGSKLKEKGHYMILSDFIKERCK